MPSMAVVKTSTLLASTVRTIDAAIGVNTTWSPAGISNGIARWNDRSGGIVVGYPWFTQSIRPPTKENRVYKVSLKMGIPRLATTAPSTNTGIEPAPTKAYEPTVHVDFLLPERSTSAERNALLLHLTGLLFATINASDDVPTDLTGSPVRSAVIDLENPY